THKQSHASELIRSIPKWFTWRRSAIRLVRTKSAAYSARETVEKPGKGFSSRTAVRAQLTFRWIPTTREPCSQQYGRLIVPRGCSRAVVREVVSSSLPMEAILGVR